MTTPGGRRPGLGVLLAKGMVAFLRVAAALVGPVRSPASPTPPRPGPSAEGMDAEVIRVWSCMVLAHARAP
ncbi:hypothetical protein AB0F17_62160 [Nonomuraea sp. NPDC026600]|uniref:hypothetical protein n=1 Tax=Nonomuraea sp. NPDC026600 TaxID=3155363 RepID=UPI0033D9F892